MNDDQRKAFAKFSRLKCGALFMSMGTGKTKVALDLAEYKFKQKKCNFILYIAPASVIKSNNIENERLKWTPDLPITYVSCEGIGASDRIYLETLQLVISHKTFCICDESLYIKNIDAKRTKRIINIGKQCHYRLVLNGTPISKNIIDLWTQLEFLSPKILKMTYKEYKDTFCEYIIKSFDRSKNGLIKGQANIPYLISLISPYIYQAELDIEYEKKYFKRYYAVDEVEYESKKEELFKVFNSKGDFDFLAFAVKLQKHYTKEQSKQDVINDLIKEINDRVIIFVKFLDNISPDAHRVTGETKNREEIFKDFEQGKFKVLYMTYGVGSFSLNLQFCKNIIFADHEFDYAKRLQSEGRIYRMNIADDVNYYDVICSNSGLEKIILKCLDKKTNLLSEVKSEIENIKGDKEKAKAFLKKM